MQKYGTGGDQLVVEDAGSGNFHSRMATQRVWEVSTMAVDFSSCTEGTCRIQRTESRKTFDQVQI